MRILALAHAIPSKRITNDWIVGTVREQNRDHLSPRQLDTMETWIRSYLDAAGTEIRYYLDAGERAIDFVVDAGRHALERASVEPSEVDFVIYTGVARGWVEPATAPAIQAALGLRHAVAFDVLEACCGWLRAVEIASIYLGYGVYRTGLIVNCECGLGWQAGWRFERPEDLEHRVAAFTIGEAATAMVVGNRASPSGFHFRFRTVGEHVGLCMVPIAGVETFHPTGGDDVLQPGRLYSRSHELIEAVASTIFEVFDSDPRFQSRHDICFGHEVSEKVCKVVTTRLRVADIYFGTHRRFGNTVAASVPLGMSVAIEEGRLRRGDKVLIVVGASGVSVGLASFTF